MKNPIDIISGLIEDTIKGVAAQPSLSRKLFVEVPVKAKPPKHLRETKPEKCCNTCKHDTSEYFDMVICSHPEHPFLERDINPEGQVCDDWEKK